MSSVPPTAAICEPFGCPEAILTNSGGQPSPDRPGTPTIPAGLQRCRAPPWVNDLHWNCFYCEGGQPNAGTFKISLSTTSASTSPSNTYPFVTGLNASNLSTNVGSDNTVVYIGTLPSLSNGTLTIPFTTPFTYNTANGDLLLDVQPFTTATNSNPFIYCWISVSVRLPTPWTFEFSMARTNFNVGAPATYLTGFALVTTFSYE